MSCAREEDGQVSRRRHEGKWRPVPLEIGTLVITHLPGGSLDLHLLWNALAVSVVANDPMCFFIRWQSVIRRTPSCCCWQWSQPPLRWRSFSGHQHGLITTIIVACFQANLWLIAKMLWFDALVFNILQIGKSFCCFYKFLCFGEFIADQAPERQDLFYWFWIFVNKKWKRRLYLLSLSLQLLSKEDGDFCWRCYEGTFGPTHRETGTLMSPTISCAPSYSYYNCFGNCGCWMPVFCCQLSHMLHKT